MSKKCPNCGYQESDDASVCHICGSALVEDKSSQDDFNYDFGAQPTQNQPSGFGFGDANNVGANNAFVNPNEVPMKIAPAKAAKLKKNLVSWSTSLIVICIIRFVFTFMELDDVNELNGMLAELKIWDPILYGPVSSYVSVYYVALVVLVLFVAAAVVLTIFSQKVNKCPIPPQNDDLFNHSKKAFFASIAITAVVVIYFILEVCSLIFYMQLCDMINESPELAETAGALVVDVLLVAGAITCLFSSLKLSKSKQN